MSSETQTISPATPAPARPLGTVGALFQREFLGYFRTPVAYVFLVVFLVAWIGLTWFVGRFFDSDDASLNLLFAFAPWVFLFLIPAVGMRLWAEERESGSWELLFTLPVEVWQAVVGKFLAAWAFVAIAILLSFPMPLTVSYLGDPDPGPIISGYFGAILMAGGYLAICSFASALTRSQVIAFVIGLIICLVMVFMGWSVLNDLLLGLGLPVRVVDSIANFSFITHFDVISKGVIRFEDIGFFLTVMIAALWFNIIALHR